MARDLSASGLDNSLRAPPTTAQEQVLVLLLDAVQKLADAGEVDAACRIAGRACVGLRSSDAKGERRFNALLHRLTRKLEPSSGGML
jgi:hypothetical protein